MDRPPGLGISGGVLVAMGVFIVWMLAVSVGLWRTPALGGVLVEAWPGELRLLERHIGAPAPQPAEPEARSDEPGST